MPDLITRIPFYCSGCGSRTENVHSLTCPLG